MRIMIMWPAAYAAVRAAGAAILEGGADNRTMSPKSSLVAALLYFYCSIHLSLEQNGVLCPVKDNLPGCVCELADGRGVIDLRPLESSGTPR